MLPCLVNNFKLHNLCVNKEISFEDKTHFILHLRILCPLKNKEYCLIEFNKDNYVQETVRKKEREREREGESERQKER